MEMTGQPHALAALTLQKQLSAKSTTGRVGEACTNFRGPAGRKGSSPHYVAHVFVSLGIVNICRLYQLTLSDQAEVTLQLTVSLAD
jgi:hypothetical protein